jgi:DHA2 family methylenomycin A resistance protein-like MFS transporter
MYTLLLSVPLLLVARGGFSSFQTGLVLTALSASMVALTPYGGRLVDRCGRRIPTVLGLLMLTLGTLPIAHAGIDIALPTLLIGLTCVGFGVGLSTSGLQTTAVECVPREEAGMASGIYSTSRYLGSILGSAILGTLLGAERSEVYNLGLVFVIVFIAALLAMIASLGLQAYPSVDAGA